MTTINVAVVKPDTDPWPNAVVTVRLIDAGTGGAVQESVIAGWSTIRCDANGEGTIVLTPNEDISPAGTYYAFHVEQSSPATVRCIEVPDSGTALSWADPTIQVLVDDPPVFIPAPNLASVGYVPTVNGTGDGFELAAGGSGSASSVGALIHAATSKTTPVDADELALADSAASWVLKKLTWANLKATAKTYFDTLYATLAHVHAGSDITSGTIGTARLGSGTANSGTYLRGDQTWAAAGATTVDVVSNVATSTILGRTTAGSGDSEELSVSSARSLLSVTDGWTKAMVQPAVGEWWPTPFATMYPGATQLNRVCYVPIWIPSGVTMIDGFAVEVTTVNATAVGRLGLYAPHATTRKPDALVIDAGTVDCSSGGGAAGVRTLACTATAVTPDSLYYVAYCAQTATAAVRQAATGLVLRSFSIPSSTASDVFVRTETLGWIEWPVTGALPSTATPTRFAAGDVQPILALKRNT